MTLYNNFWLKRGVGLFSRVGLFSGGYGTWHEVRVFENAVSARFLLFTVVQISYCMVAHAIYHK